MGLEVHTLLRKLLYGSASIAFANGLSKVFTLGFMILAARVLGVTDFGSLALILSWGLILATLPSAGFPQALLWKLGSAKNEKEREKFLACALFGTGALLIIALIIVLLVPSIPLQVAVVLLANCLTQFFLNMHLGLLNHLQVALFSAGRSLVNLILITVLWLELFDLEANVSHVVLIYLFSPICVITLIEMKFRTTIRFRPANYNEDEFREMRRYALPLIMSALTMAFILHGDVVILEYYHGEAQTSGYYAAKRLLLPVLLLPVAVRGLLIPSLSGAKLTTEQIHRMFIIVMGISVPLAGMVGLFGPQIVELLYGKDFDVARQLTLLFGGAALILAAHQLVVAVLLGHGRSWQVFMTDLAGAVVGAIGFVVMIPPSGSEGAAMAVVLGSLTALVLSLIFIFRGAETNLIIPQPKAK